tara:strand:- start:261 stop:629 length:369 start_codon:yes stop_codon:yes gene_type:complete
MATNAKTKKASARKGTKTATSTPALFVGRAFNGTTIESASINIAFQSAYDNAYSVAKDVLSKGVIKLATSIGQNDRLIVDKDVKRNERQSWTPKQASAMALFFAINALINAEREAIATGLIK